MRIWTRLFYKKKHHIKVVHVSNFGLSTQSSSFFPAFFLPFYGTPFYETDVIYYPLPFCVVWQTNSITGAALLIIANDYRNHLSSSWVWDGDGNGVSRHKWPPRVSQPCHFGIYVRAFVKQPLALRCVSRFAGSLCYWTLDLGQRWASYSL